MVHLYIHVHVCYINITCSLKGSDYTDHYVWTLDTGHHWKMCVHCYLSNINKLDIEKTFAKMVGDIVIEYFSQHNTTITCVHNL